SWPPGSPRTTASRPTSTTARRTTTRLPALRACSRPTMLQWPVWSWRPYPFQQIISQAAALARSTASQVRNRRT
ncbi:unnamed protein product, partial [Heterosigma akashiwo]